MALESTSTVINYYELFHMRDPLASRPLRLNITEDSDWVTNDVAWKIFKGQYTLSEPLKFDVYQGGGVYDFLWSTMVALVCVSSRVIDLLMESNISGWSTYPVEIYDGQGNIISGYSGLAITGAEYTRDRSRSVVITKPAPTPTGMPYKVYKGLYFDEQNWDGKDFFLVRSNLKIVTQNVYNLFKKNKVANVRFISLRDVELDVFLDQFENVA